MSEYVKEVRGRTRIPVEACNFTWSIENFSSCPFEEKECLTSPKFTTGQSLSPMWCLQLYPNRKKSTGTEIIGIFLKHLDAQSSSRYVTVEISIIDSNKTKCHAKSSKHNFNQNKPDWGWFEFICRNVVLKEERLSLLPNDTLTVMCELKVTVDVKTSEGTEELIANDYPFSVSKNPDSLVGSLQHLYDNEMCSDLTLKVGDEELKVHKLILCACSSVFNKMLNCDMKESITNCVEITDFDPSVVKTMLRYIYCEQIETPEISIQLYSIADKYNLRDLKNTCIKYLLKNLNVDNICDALVLGELHIEPELMTAAKKMFCANAAAIQKTEKWLDLSKTMPDLVFSMYQFVISQNET